MSFGSSPRRWFVSYPSGGMQHTPTFFTAISNFSTSQQDIQIVLPHNNAEDVKLTRDDIASCELVLVEVSIPSTGSGIELGWANATGKPVIAFHQGGSEPSPALKFVTTELHVYVTEDNIIDSLRKLAEKQS